MSTTATQSVYQHSKIQKSDNSFPEIQGTMKSDGELWALLFFDSATPSKDLKFAWRITSSGEGLDFHAQAQNESGKTILPIWEPEYHGGSSWQRPGIEWGAGFLFSRIRLLNSHSRKRAKYERCTMALRTHLVKVLRGAHPPVAGHNHPIPSLSSKSLNSTQVCAKKMFY